MTAPAVRVVDARVVEQGGEVGRGAASARSEWAERRGLVLELVDAEGRVGRGEASPLPRYSRDDHAAARATLDGAPWARVGAVPLDGRPPHAALREALDAAGEGSAAARFAVETAFLDLIGQATGHPLWALLDPAFPPPPRVPLARLLPASLEPAELVGAARAAVAEGWRTLKVKIGRSGAFDDELLALQSMRLAVGDDVAIRLDANGTLLAGEHQDRAASLGRRLDALATIRPELLEEPAAVESMLFHRTPAVPFALDETLLRPDAFGLLDRALATGACRAVVLKPMALGGLDRCLALARRAAAGGADAIVSHLFDGPVAWLAAGHLALVLAARRRGDLAHGLGPHAGFAAWPDVALEPLSGPWLRPALRPGLGLPRAIPWRPPPSTPGSGSSPSAPRPAAGRG